MIPVIRFYKWWPVINIIILIVINEPLTENWEFEMKNMQFGFRSVLFINLVNLQNFEKGLFSYILYWNRR